MHRLLESVCPMSYKKKIITWEGYCNFCYSMEPFNIQQGNTPATKR